MSDRWFFWDRRHGSSYEDSLLKPMVHVFVLGGFSCFEKKSLSALSRVKIFQTSLIFLSYWLVFLKQYKLESFCIFELESSLLPWGAPFPSQLIFRVVYNLVNHNGQGKQK
jgi:hypothetical protein